MQAIFQKFPKKLWGRVCWWWLHPGLVTIHHSPFLSPVGPSSDSISKSIFARRQHSLCTIHYGRGRYIVIGGTSHAGIDLWSTVSRGQVIYTHRCEAFVCALALGSSCKRTHRGSFGYLPSSSHQAAISWEPVTVLQRVLMGVLFKEQRNLVKVWPSGSLSEKMQSQRGERVPQTPQSLGSSLRRRRGKGKLVNC